MSVKNQSKNKKKYEFEKQSTPPKDVVNVASQTESSEKEDGSCQTDTPERKYVQVQTSMKQTEPIATQTENSPKCDFQSQANIQQQGSSVAVQTIKEEVVMPNIPNSAASVPAKKRKLSSTSSASSRNLERPTQATRKSSRNQLADVGSGNHVKNVQDAADEKILNSEIYKIYCRNEDPKEAIKQIRELKTCIYFEQSTQPALAEDDLKRESEKTLNELWKFEPLDDSKFIKIKKYLALTHI